MLVIDTYFKNLTMSTNGMNRTNSVNMVADYVNENVGLTGRVFTITESTTGINFSDSFLKAVNQILEARYVSTPSDDCDSDMKWERACGCS